MNFKPFHRLMGPLLAALMLFVVTGAYDYTEIRINGTSGGYFNQILDSSDTGAGGSLVYVDTFTSDVFELDSTCRFLTYMANWLTVDTGAELLDDTTGTLIIIEALTRSAAGGPIWRLTADTMSAVGDSFRYTYVTDTMLYNLLWFRSIIIDSLDMTGVTEAVDTNIYDFFFFVLNSGPR